MRNKNIFFKVWEIAYPFVMYEAIYSFAIFFATLFIGSDTEKYMLCQIIGTLITLPFIYFSFTRKDKAEGISLEGKPDSEPLNIIFIIAISLVLGLALNNLLCMSPLYDLSQGYKEANSNFYGSTVLIELIGSALLTPILEEMVFRGVIYTRLRRLFGNNKILAITIAALLFALVHGNILQFIYALIMGGVFCVFMEKTGRLYGPVLAHITVNCFAVLRTEFNWLSFLTDKSAFAWTGSIVLLVLGLALFIIYVSVKKHKN